MVSPDFVGPRQNATLRIGHRACLIMRKLRGAGALLKRCLFLEQSGRRVRSESKITPRNASQKSSYPGNPTHNKRIIIQEIRTKSHQKSQISPRI